jgi:TetR/AcrR family transcriptional regulator, transcriptional repressor for nem operon
MGRKKNYDRDELVGKAMEIFRDHGFAGTSAEMLVEGLGVNRYSLYAEFGSKQGLFDAALKRYDDEVMKRNFGPLEAPGGGIDEVRALLEFFGSAGKGAASGRGCFLCNTAIELGPTDPSGAGFVQRYFARLSEAFYVALSRGELRHAADPRKEADFFTASVLGLFVMLRAKALPTTIENAALVAIKHLEDLRA